VLFSYTKPGLQILLNKLHTYCNEWGITVNTDKTVCMVFKKCKRVEQFDMFYNNNRLTVVQKVTYLGVTLSSNGLFYQAQKALANQSLKSLFALNSIFDTVALETTDKKQLFDSLVAPILNYSPEVWGFHDANDVENIHLKLLKQVLGVHSNTSNPTIYGEFARFPLSAIRKIRIIRYWYRNPSSLMYTCMYLKDKHGTFINTWSKHVISLVSSLGYAYIWYSANVSDVI